MKKYLNFIVEFIWKNILTSDLIVGINKVVNNTVRGIKFIVFIRKNSLGIRAAKYEKMINKPPTIIRKMI